MDEAKEIAEQYIRIANECLNRPRCATGTKPMTIELQKDAGVPVGTGEFVRTPLNVNTQGVAVMRSELPQDAQAHFDKFVARAREHDHAKEPRIWSNIRITQEPEDGRVLLLRAFMCNGKVGLHAKIYLRGIYGVLLS